ncbi:hypothetical protein JCM10207_005300 [Rhodosporidiobolus poonsookiae]
MASDPLSTAHTADTPAEPSTPTAVPQSPWQTDELFATPFSGSSWTEGPSISAWGDATSSTMAPEAADGPARTEESAQAGADDEEGFTYPTSPPPDHTKSSLRSSVLRADAPSFSPSTSSPPATAEPAPSAAPITTPSPPASSLRRERSSSTSGILPATSVTPRGNDSPLSRMASREPPVEEDLSSTPAASSHLAARPSPVRSASTASSVKGYDPTVRRNLIATAASNGDLERLKSLMKGEDGTADFSLANETSPHTGLAPLHYAVRHADVVQWLIEQAGAMAELEDADGETALHKAALRGYIDVCRFLVSRGVDVDAQDSDGWTPLHNAASRGWLDVASLLVEAGASIDKPNKHDYTALMSAASRANLPLVHYLLKQGADPFLRNSFGETAFDLAAAVFEVQICHVLAAAEAAKYVAEDSARPPFNPLDLHTTVPVLLQENQRLALPTLKKLSSLGTIANPRWTAKALSRNDGRAAFSMPPLVGSTSTEPDLPVFRSEVGLPVIGAEGELVLPERRQVRSGGRVQVLQPAPADEGGKCTPRPSTTRRGSAASASLNAVLASSSSSSVPLSPSTKPSNTSASRGEPAWLWLSDWTVDTTSPRSSPVDGWSYASSFDAPADEWSPEPPVEVRRAFEGGPSLALSGKKWVRRRNWVRVMRRRLDLPSWGYADEPSFPRRPSLSIPPTPSASTSTAPAPPATLDYRARAQFLAGAAHAPATSDSASIRSGKTVQTGGADDRAELKKAVARLQRAADELRQGMVTDEDSDNRRRAEEELETFLHRAALLGAELGVDELEDEGDSDDEFIYSGKDAGDDDDARSIWTSAPRPSSVASQDEPLAGPSDYFAQPIEPADESYPDLTPQLARAPEFRVPTHETAASFHPSLSPEYRPRELRPRWEPDEATSECRRCSKKFSLFNRKHHCRRCGLVVCASCSPHQDQLDPTTIALEPGTYPDDQPWLTGLALAYRTCHDCHAALSLPQGVGTASLLSPQAFFPASPSLGSVTPSEAGQSDTSELAECPVCGTTLAGVGDKPAQEAHIRDCLEQGGGSIASGRYLVFRLPPSPLVGEECKVCFEEFEVGDKMARLVCLCTFHETCLSAWLSRGRSCPVHASRDS